MDWVQAKVDYITDSKETYASLAERYGISPQRMRQRGWEEHWTQLRREHASEVCEKTVEAIADQAVVTMTQTRVERIAHVQGAAEALLAKLEAGIVQMDSKTLTRSANLPKGLASAIRDIKEILELRPDADLREQEARIERLKKGVETDKDGGIKLVIEGGERGWMQ